jgi:hypothetical protein
MKTVHITIWLSPKEKAILVKRAGAERYSVSGYAVQMLYDAGAFE